MFAFQENSDSCQLASSSLASQPAAQRRDPDNICCSVAQAASYVVRWQRSHTCRSTRVLVEIGEFCSISTTLQIVFGKFSGTFRWLKIEWFSF